ncbi:MAG: hypothetical protein JSV05_02980 [Candidatus Bathyarchaeota archaeon]|nr:MAG: hypothetical protein JSV05_02980 [Candidatus Bathyarchaeota archaeon]
MHRLKIAILLLFFLTIAMNMPTMADSVGVRRGDFAEYEFSYTGEGPLGAPKPISWLKLEFLEVGYYGESTAYIRVTLKFADDDEPTLLTASVELFEVNWMHAGFVIPADSEIGDAVVVEGIWNGRDPPVQAEIEGEETRACLDVNRTAVYANYSISDESHIETTSNKVYWDKQTGVLVEGLYHTLGNESIRTTLVVLTECSQRLWPHDMHFFGLERWQLVAIIVSLGGTSSTAIVLVLYRRKRRIE